MISLIPQPYLNEACFLSLNVDNKKYSMVLKLAQEDLEDVLGVTFYAEIETQYNTQELTDDNDALYEDYIKDYLAWRTYFHFLKFANLDQTPTGIREFTDDNSTVASDIKMYALEKNVKARADNYKFRLINFIKLEQSRDSTKYPYFTESCKEEMSFGITAVGKESTALFKVNKAITTNE
jgi:hypothetical protein